MKRLWKMLKGNRRSRKQQSANAKPVFENLEPRLLLNAVPYIQDFSLGKPDAAAGWTTTRTMRGGLRSLAAACKWMIQQATSSTLQMRRFCTWT